MESVEEEIVSHKVKKNRRVRENRCGRLPLDIIHDILSRLRVKTLCKFLCVSKSWYALISDPIFQSSHDLRAKENPLVILSNSIGGAVRVSLLDSEGNLVEKSTIEKEASSVHSPLMGWWSTISPDLVFFDEFYNVYVHNTFTRELVKMPRTRNLVDRCVLAHAPSTKQYKLLAIGFSNSFATGESYQYEVITIGDDCWRTVSNPPIPISAYFGGVHTEEAIYMMPRFDNDDPYVKGIVRFDLEREEWSVVPAPPGPSFHGRNSCILRGTGEQVRVAEWSSLGEEEFDLWSLKDRDKGVWMKEYCKVRMDPRSCHSLLPVAIDNNGRVLIQMCDLLADPCKYNILLYNSDGRRNDFQVISEDERYNLDAISFYVESFEKLRCFAFAEARDTSKEKEPDESTAH